MQSTLLTQKSQPTSSKLAPDALADFLPQIPEWQLNPEKNTLSRTFKFKNYHESVAFLNATAYISHREDHHPDIELTYNKVTLHYSTHSAGGLTLNDIICAAKVDTLQNI